MKFKYYLETRTHGKTLPEIGYKDKYVRIYRAVPLTETKFKSMDYVGVDAYGLRFAKGHAVHQAAIENEAYHVITALVLAQDVAEAYNPGEYFYIGTEVNGRIVGGTRIEG